MIGMNGIDLMIDVNNDVLVYASFLFRLPGQPEFGKGIISGILIPVTSHHVINLT